MQCVVFRYSILQYILNQPYMFRSLMGSSSGIRIRVTFHKTELAVYVHIKRYKKTISYDVGDFVMDPWYTVYWRCLRMCGWMR